MINSKQAKEVLGAVSTAGGVAVKFDGDALTGDGFLVAIDGLGTVVRLEGLTAVNVQSLVNSLILKVDGLADPATHGVVVREEQGEVYFDIARLVSDAVEAANRAERNEQSHLWNIEAGEVVEVSSVA